MRKSAKPAIADVTVESYRLVSIDPTAAPTGETSTDWLVYRLAQGENMVTGYRRGSYQAVRAEVERILDALNDRLLGKRSPYRSAGRPPKAAPAAQHKDIV